MLPGTCQHQVIDLRKESTTATLLDQCDSLLHSKSHPFLYIKQKKIEVEGESFTHTKEIFSIAYFLFQILLVGIQETSFDFVSWHCCL